MSDRFSRYSSILPVEELNTRVVSMVGVGAIGRQVALQLAAAGQKHIILFDHDTVEEANLGPQGYFVKDVGVHKVDATAEVMLLQNPEAVITKHCRRLGAADQCGSVMCCCVVSIETRASILSRYKDSVQLFIDGRMAAETLRVLTAHASMSKEYYATTLFSAQESYEGSCTARSTIYTSNIAAGMMVQQYAKFLRGMHLDQDILFNLLAAEIQLDIQPCLS